MSGINNRRRDIQATNDKVVEISPPEVSFIVKLYESDVRVKRFLGFGPHIQQFSPPNTCQKEPPIPRLSTHWFIASHETERSAL
jgi:hypothetical protein